MTTEDTSEDGAGALPVRPALDLFGSPQACASFLDSIDARLRGPLRALENVAESLTAARSPDQQRQLLAAVRHATFMIERCSSAMLDVARVQNGLLEPEQQPFSVRSLLHECVIMARSAEGPATRLFQLQLPQDDLILNGDAPRLVRILSTVLCAVDNWAEEGSPLTLTASWEDIDTDRSRLDVRMRVSADAVPKSPRLQLPALDPSQPGVPRPDGIELHAALAVARCLGLSIHPTEVPPGLVISLTAPRLAHRPRPVLSVDPTPVRELSVLLLDTPSRLLRAVESGLLERGIITFRARHRDEAIGMLYGRAPSAILVAIDPGNDDGLQLARRIRAAQPTSQLPILLVAHEMTSTQLSLARRVVDAILVAPADPADVASYLNGCLRVDRRRAARVVSLF